MNPTALQISSWLPRSIAHGPGQRFVLWVQGCTLGCPGCFSPHTHDRTGGKSIAVDDLVRLILATEGIEGITISGGEPLFQPSPLALLAETVRRHGFTVMCYTGFTLTELRSRRQGNIHRFLRALDILVDGRFERREAAPLRWRGSRNQQIHFLSEKYRQLEEESDDTTQVELLVRQDEFTTTGVWPESFLEQLVEAASGVAS